MNKKGIFIIIGIILLASLAGVVWYGKSKKQPVQSGPLPFQEIPSQHAPAPKDKTLPAFKKTGVQDLEGPYKKVSVSDGDITFSFEVPDEWLTETRNSGEVEMNEEELREYLATNYDGDIKKDPSLSGDYWDFTWEMLKDMSYGDMKEYYEQKRDTFSPGFPNASVSASDNIWYTDLNGKQIDFYIISDEISKKYYEFLGKNYAPRPESTEKQISISGYHGMIIEDNNTEGKGAGGSFAYIYAPEFKKYVIIRKILCEEQ